MDLLPTLKIGMLNGWLPLIIYFIGLILSALLYSKKAIVWLFNNPKANSGSAARKLTRFTRSGAIVKSLASPAYQG